MFAVMVSPSFTVQFILCAPMCPFQCVPAVMCPVYWSVVSVRGVSVSRRCSLGVVVSLLLRSLTPVSSFPFQVYPVSRCPCLRIRVSPDEGSFFETQTCTSARAVPQLSIAALRLGLEPRASALNRPVVVGRYRLGSSEVGQQHQLCRGGTSMPRLDCFWQSMRHGVALSAIGGPRLVRHQVTTIRAPGSFWRSAC